MHLRMLNHNPRPRQVPNREFQLPPVPAKPPDRSRQVVPSQHLPHLKRLDAQPIHPKHCHDVYGIKSEHEGVHAVGAPLQPARIGGARSGTELDPERLEIHPNVDSHIIADRSADLEPRLFQRGIAVRWHGDFTEALDLFAGDFVSLELPEVRFLREQNQRILRRSRWGFDILGDGSGAGGDAFG
ncbi:hypothetical protein OROHE_019692 [Orobanche hederae]